MKPTTPKAKSLLSHEDLYLFNEGSHVRLYDHLGSHLTTGDDGKPGVAFAVWAPDAERVAVMGDFNGWSKDAHVMKPHGSSGIWETFIPGLKQGAIYKYQVDSRYRMYKSEKADPFAFHAETPPKTGSIVWDLGYKWDDSAWMKERGKKNALTAPISIYEMHIGSWRCVPEDGNRPLSYREMAEQLPAYLAEKGFTHVEFMPVMEHPFGGSWGYQVTGFFAPTSRFGTPQDFMFLIDKLHQHNIGVILDWVPSHFPTDVHGLGYFDGTHLYEHSDRREGWHPDWNSLIFNFGRNEVRSFLFSSGLFWLDKFHADGLRVDAVASMLYRDYSRKAGEWIPNKFGGRENLEAVDFLRRFNAEVYKHHPDTQTIAEESTDWPAVSRPTYVGGLGFGLKWDMGWMHDTLKYWRHDPVHRRFHHNEITFRMLYAFHENFTLPLSHDEVVHGKCSLIRQMPGDDWQRFANLRALYSYMWAQAGKKLLFMGGEFGQWDEWNHNKSLDWHLTQFDSHRGLSLLISDLNRVYRSEAALHEMDVEPAGFSWVDANDSSQSVLSFLRFSRSGEEAVLVLLNLTPVPRMGYRVGVPWGGEWTELLNTDAREYWGSGVGNQGKVWASDEGFHWRPSSLSVNLPPLSGLYLKGDCRRK